MGQGRGESTKARSGLPNGEAIRALDFQSRIAPADKAARSISGRQL